MDKIISVIISILFGAFGSLLIEWYKSRNQNRNALMLKYNTVMEEKYRTIIIYMQCVLDIHNKRFFHLVENEALNCSSDCLDALKAYYYNGMLYSSEHVLREFKLFVLCPTENQLVKTIMAMRKEIWGKGNRLTDSDLTLH